MTEHGKPRCGQGSECLHVLGTGSRAGTSIPYASAIWLSSCMWDTTVGLQHTWELRRLDWEQPLSEWLNPPGPQFPHPRIYSSQMLQGQQVCDAEEGEGGSREGLCDAPDPGHPSSLSPSHNASLSLMAGYSSPMPRHGNCDSFPGVRVGGTQGVGTCVCRRRLFPGMCHQRILTVTCEF